MNEQTIGLRKEEMIGTFNVNDFPLVLEAYSREAHPTDKVDANLKVNCIASDTLMKAGRHGFKIVVAWSLSRQKELMPHSMLGAAIQRCSATGPGLVASIELQIVNNNPERSRVIAEQRCTVTGSLGWWPTPYAASREPSDGFIPLEEALDPANGWLKNGTLTVKCKMTVAVTTAEIVQSIEMPDTRASDDLSAQLGALFETGHQSDVTIVVGQERIDAHSLILSARSPVFSAMWSHGMREKEEKEVVITDLEPSIVRSMLGFMYTGKLDSKLDNSEHTVSLLRAAHKYEVSVLVELCVAALSSQLTNETAIRYLMLADLTSIGSLQEKCLQFITSSSDKLADVQSTGAYAQMAEKRPHLLGEILAAAFPPAKAARFR
mmetsp:Transcript_48819/g.136666  ORF Transcript_48819/g.136666 Transcript_48819/m.136666 type:complete len:378 (-) Transcript_48819:221-1354(-)